MTRWISAAALLLGLVGGAHAFETQTHAYFAYQAYLNSNLGNANGPALLAQLGLDRLDPPQPFVPYWITLSTLDNFYYDNTPDGANPLDFLRPATAYEWVQFQQLGSANALGSNPSSVVGNTPFTTLPISNWLLRGAIREDDLEPSYYEAGDGPAPDLDPRGSFLRVFNHFYDPIHDTGLVPPVPGACVLAPSGCQKSVDWALGTTDAFNSQAASSTRHNHFTWVDARNNYFLALTAERDANADGMRTAAEREADSEERLYRWATTFRYLGDVVHLLQDTAQPQHTRNDRHDPHVNPQDQQGFEPFTNARVLQTQQVGGVAPSGGEIYVRGLNKQVFSQFATPLPDINGYPVPTFVTPLRFFTTRAEGDTALTSPDGRLGLADYSNRGFFTRGTTPDIQANAGVSPSIFPYPRPDRTLSGFSVATVPCPFLQSLRGEVVNCVVYSHSVPDPAAPTRSDATTAEPLVGDGMWKDLFASQNQYTLSPQIFQVTGNLTAPRAIAYSAGIINYFFRGRLAVTAPPDRIVAVLNQGAPHTMNPQGYPCVGTVTTDGCPIFGFKSIRVSVQNTTLVTPTVTTPQITETGTGTVDPQTLSATVAGNANDPSFTSPALFAVARYHRNTCYQPSMSGERQQAYATPPTTGLITEPTCASGQTVRTAYSEISVSSSAVVSAATLNGTSPFEVHFDFSADPIPVNATDLFIQVVYRGPMGDATNGQELNGMAVGTLDVREPTFTAFWNNTDFFWNGSIWQPHNSAFRNEGVKDFWECAGGFPLKMIFQYTGGTGAQAMIDPVSNSGAPGMVRLGIVFPPPEFANQGKSISGTPVQNTGDSKISVNQGGTQGQWGQASMENVPAATLTAPVATCNAALPTTLPYWCFDPIQKRRGQPMGTPDLPMALVTTGASISGATDVDAVPLAPFTGLVPLSSGTILFDTATTLASCSAQPSAVEDDPAYLQYLQSIEVLEEARDLGVSGERF